MNSAIESALRADLPDVRQGVNRRMVCPECGPTRKKKRERTLSVKRDGDSLLWHCWHCDAKGGINLKPKVETKVIARQPEQKLLTIDAIRFLNKRKITREVAERYGVFSTDGFFRKLGSRGERGEAIGFPYFNSGMIYASKLRCIEEKDHLQVGACQTLWGLDLVGDTDKLVIVEGELDALAMASCGIENVVSVPNGAPNSEPVDIENDKRFGFIRNSETLLDQFDDIYLAGDMDRQGEVMVDELARRLGKHRCWRVKWPEGCKDANATLLRFGKEGVEKAMAEAERFPVAGLFEPDTWFSNIDKLYSHGAGKGKSTGYASLDSIYTVVPGSLTIVTGFPGSGKSELLDQLAVRLSDREDWPVVMVSPENEPDYHLVKIIQKKVGKHFFTGSYNRMTREELEEGKRWVQKRFLFCHQADGSLNTVEGIIERLKAAVVRYGVRMAVVDPVNYIDMPDGVSETKWVSDMLTKFRVFAQHHEVALFLVAHPRTVYPGKDGKKPEVDGTTISGSAHYFNKADFGLTVKRENPVLDPTEVCVTSWKCRHSWAGRVGTINLDYDEETTRYFEPRRR